MLVLEDDSPLAETTLAWRRTQGWVVGARINHAAASLIVEYDRAQQEIPEGVLSLLRHADVDDRSLSGALVGATNVLSSGRPEPSDTSLLRSSRCRGRIAAVEPAEHACGQHAGEQNAQAGSCGLICSVKIKVSYADNEEIGDDEVREPPNHVHGRGRKTLTRRLGEWTLKRPPHYTADEVWNSVRQGSTAEQV
jgi:hypothetical protein